MGDKGKGDSDKSIGGALRDCFTAFANEVGSSVSLSGPSSSPSTSGSGTHTNSSGGPDGSSSSGGWGITERHDKWGNSVSHTDSAGKQYGGGMMGWIDSLGGTNSTGHSVQNGNRTEHYDNSDKLQAVSVRQSDGSELSYDTEGRFLGAFTPDRSILEADEAEAEGYSSDDVDIDDLLDDGDDGYDKGWSDGWDDGHHGSITDRIDTDWTPEYAEGYKRGYEAGLKVAWDSGDTDGYMGEDPSYDGESYLDGHANGKARDIETGEKDGLNGEDPRYPDDPFYMEGHQKGWQASADLGEEDGYNSESPRYDDASYMEGYEKGKERAIEEGREDARNNEPRRYQYDEFYLEGYEEVEAELEAEAEALAEVQAEYDASYQKGYKDGHSKGYIDGRAGRKSTFKLGGSVGYIKGHKDGYKKGHEEGWAEDDPHLTEEEMYCGPATDRKKEATRTIGQSFMEFRQWRDSGEKDGRLDRWSPPDEEGVVSGYNFGWDKGNCLCQIDYALGHKLGYLDGYRRNYTNRSRQAKTLGLQSGFKEGYRNGFERGHTDRLSKKMPDPPLNKTLEYIDGSIQGTYDAFRGENTLLNSKSRDFRIGYEHGYREEKLVRRSSERTTRNWDYDPQDDQDAFHEGYQSGLLGEDLPALRLDYNPTMNEAFSDIDYHTEFSRGHAKARVELGKTPVKVTRW